jgi:hypothetical protein
MDDVTRLEVCARAAHEANRAWCIANGDDSQLSWEAAPEWQRTSALNGVIGALNGHTPEQSHEAWLAEKLAAGWKHGEVKNPDTKEHPCMVPYDELPQMQRTKDKLLISVARAVGCAIGIDNIQVPIPKL